MQDENHFTTEVTEKVKIAFFEVTKNFGRKVTWIVIPAQAGIQRFS